VRTARDYYNSGDADNFYFSIWGGEDIHIGLYEVADEDIGEAAQRTVATMAGQLEVLNAGSRIIDLGAGYGGAARWLAGTAHCHVTCLNLSDVQNARNRELTAAAGLDSRIEVVDGSFEDIPYGDGEFDVAWSQDSMLHSGDRGRVVREIDRVLKPGGEVIFTDPMQADGCPAGVLAPVLERIHLTSLGSFAFYRQQAAQLGWEERLVLDLSGQLVAHYSRVRQELLGRRAELGAAVSAPYVERMIEGLTHWILAGESGYLAWGILHFRKPL
jgi:sarcosine/dimethylglycine N-methyltransferase